MSGDSKSVNQITHLKTYHVKVKWSRCINHVILFYYLKTYHVKVKFRAILFMSSSETYLKTYHVKVK